MQWKMSDYQIYFDLLKMKKTISSKRDLVMSARRLNEPDDQIFFPDYIYLHQIYMDRWTLKTRDASEYLILCTLKYFLFFMR